MDIRHNISMASFQHLVNTFDGVNHKKKTLLLNVKLKQLTAKPNQI